MARYSQRSKRTHVVSTAELEADNVAPLCSDLLRVKPLRGASCNGSDRSCAFATRKPTRPGWPSLLAPTKTVILTAETSEGAKAARMATEEAAENFMVLNVMNLEWTKRLRRLVKCDGSNY